MDWANEQYILVYVRDSGDWLMWSWQTRAVMLFLLRKVNRAGILDLGKGKLRALAKILEMPEGELSEAIAPLLEDGCVQLHEEKLIIPNFIPAQEAKHSDKARKQMSRERERSRLLSQPVTRGHTESHEVTLPYPTQSNPTLAEQSKGPDTAAPLESEEPEPDEVTNVRYISDRPPPPADPQMRYALEGDHLQVYQAIRKEPKLSQCDAFDLAANCKSVTDRRDGAWLVQAVFEAARDTPPGELAHLTQKRVRAYLQYAKGPKREATAAKPPAHVEDTGPIVKVTAQMRQANAAKARAIIAGIGRPIPPANSTEAQLRDKAQADQMRLAELEVGKPEAKAAGKAGGV